MLPIYTKNISSSDFETYNTNISVITLFTMIIYVDIGVGTMNFLLDKNKEKSSDEIISSLFVIFILSFSTYHKSKNLRIKELLKLILKKLINSSLLKQIYPISLSLRIKI